MDELETKLLEYLNGAEALILSKAPTVYQGTLALVQIDSILTLLTGTAFLIALFFCARFFWKTSKKIDDEEEKVPFFMMALIFNVPLLVAAWTNLFNKAALIGALNPELGLLYGLYTKITGAN